MFRQAMQVRPRSEHRILAVETMGEAGVVAVVTLQDMEGSITTTDHLEGFKFLVIHVMHRGRQVQDMMAKLATVSRAAKTKRLPRTIR